VQLIGYELSRIVYLTNIRRLAGGAFLPELAHQVIQRYSFVKSPTLDELQKEGQTFAFGKYQDVQINEFKVFTDGVIVSGMCSTDVLDGFLHDLFGWLQTAHGLEEIRLQEPEKYFESGLLVQAERNLVPIISPPKRVTDLIQKTISQITDVEFQATTTYLEADPKAVTGRRRPNRFTLERKIGLPFSTNAFYSQAPLRSGDHFTLLEGLEGLAG
jgi:hypothetical protein